MTLEKLVTEGSTTDAMRLNLVRLMVFLRLQEPLVVVVWYSMQYWEPEVQTEYLFHSGLLPQLVAEVEA